MVVRRKPDQTCRAGEQAVDLVKTDKAKMEPRMRGGLLAGLVEDLVLLDDTSAKQKSARVQKRSATLSQEEIAELLARLIQTMRTSVRLVGQSREVQAAVGVGRPLRANVVGSVIAGAEMILDAYAQIPDALRGAGVLPADIEAIVSYRDKLRAVNGTQEVKKLTAKEKTALRNQVHARVEDAIACIVAAAGLAFFDDSARLAMYQALLPSTKSAAKPANPPAV